MANATNDGNQFKFVLFFSIIGLKNLEKSLPEEMQEFSIMEHSDIPNFTNTLLIQSIQFCFGRFFKKIFLHFKYASLKDTEDKQDVLFQNFNFVLSSNNNRIKFINHFYTTFRSLYKNSHNKWNNIKVNKNNNSKWGRISSAAITFSLLFNFFDLIGKKYSIDKTKISLKDISIAVFNGLLYGSYKTTKSNNHNLDLIHQLQILFNGYTVTEIEKGIVTKYLAASKDRYDTFYFKKYK
ncbi:hypothetical protein RFI_31660 [Reticulomyxa filosa]|uniref:Uncharacterized protein n=1 Tax=Reticulomyxa filosa TaxID=46433 RepID=X6LX70_RETFI|nr:hypothetical protein RFI_31660 [Reticulomyxa filosa]|eukprot:ETO05737.1 hypothetical protein RFI_31660 [Reticulomyxa filosa]